MVLFKTLINRDMWMNPLCDVWGVWGIYRYNTVTGQRILTSECIENFFLLMPYIVLMFWNFEEKIFGGAVPKSYFPAVEESVYRENHIKKYSNSVSVISDN